MEKQIKVVDCNGKNLLDTYSKRARQLVKNKRAVWVSNEQICLVNDTNREAYCMNEISTDSDFTEMNLGNGVKKVVEEVHTREPETKEKTFENELLLELAKNRVEMRRSIIWQFIDIVVLSVVICWCIFVAWGGPEVALFSEAVFMFFWCVRYFIRFLKYSDQSSSGFSFKKMIDFFRNKNDEEILTEYNRLKSKI